MKNTLLLALAVLAVCPVFAQTPLPNSSFESWTNYNPDGWFTNNAYPYATPVTQVTDAHSGTYALKGTVITYLSNAVLPVAGSNASTPFQFHQMYTSLNFYLKLHRVGANDGIYVSLTVSDSAQYPIAYGEYKYSAEATNYVPITVPISYIGSSAPATCNFTITLADTLADTAAQVGSYFIIDDVAFGGFVSDVKNTPAVVALNAFPNPSTTGQWLITTDNAWLGAQTEIYNTAGQMVYSSRINLTPVVINNGALPKGLYVARLSSAEKTATLKLAKE